MAENYDAVVIGAGPGGLATAALLGKQGLRILVTEKNDRVGGKAATFSKNGFKYELWPIAYMPLKDNAFDALFKELEIESELKPAWDYESDEQLVGFYYRGRSGEYRKLSDTRPKNTSNPDNLFNFWELESGEKDEALRFLTYLILMTPEQIDELDDISMHEFMSRHQIPGPLYDYMAMHSNISILEPVDQASASEQVKVIKEMALQGAAGYFKGGYSRVCEVLADVIRSQGGVVRTGERIEKIEVVDGHVTGIEVDGKTIAASIVISSAGIQPTALKLVDEAHFDASYLEYVKGLIPGLNLLTTRYFLSKPILDQPLYLTYSGETVWNAERYERIREGKVPEEVSLWMVVPSNYDPEMAPEGKQLVIASTVCSPDPEAKEVEMLWEKTDEMVAKLWPELIEAIELKERGGPAQVSAMARDHVLSGQGGEAIGIGQVVGQCGRHKPSPKAPIHGLFYVGTDAGGEGVGTVQAVDSAFNVTKMVLEHHQGD